MSADTGAAPVAPGRLARLGFRDVATAQERVRMVATLAAPDADGGIDQLLGDLARSADPDAALAGVAALVEAADDAVDLLRTVAADVVLRTRLAAVCGASPALAEHLAAHPEHWHDLRAGRPTYGEQPLLAAGDATAPEAADVLRVAYRRRLLGVAASDLTGETPVAAVGAALADLADATLQAALDVAAARLPAQAAQARLAVIALGKSGGRELNYVSDVDVVFVHEPIGGTGDGGEDTASRAAAQLASTMMRVCSEHTGAGTVWPVDAALRPEGRAGPLSRTVSGHRGYYERWASSWEFQALLKARPAAGDRALGAAYLDAITPLVWQAGERPGFVAEVQSMRRKVVDHIPVEQVPRALKLGPGGLRDVEFAVQLLQLVHGRGDETLRGRSTLGALEALTRGGYVGRDDGAALARSYEFLRTVEHRLQLWALRRTQVLPDDDETPRRLGRALGHRSDPAAAFERDWAACTREVRRLHEKLFYRPLLAAVAALPGAELRLSTDAAKQRLAALGYVDSRSALGHLEALTAGLTRRAAIQRQLLPALLGWFAAGPDPDAALLAFRRVSDRLGTTHWYLRRLRDEGETAQLLARVLASSGYATDLLLGAPDSVALLGGGAELVPRPREVLLREMTSAAHRHADPGAGIEAVRAMRRRELCRVAVADVLGLLDVEAVGDALTDVTLATLTGALAVATQTVGAELREPVPIRIAVVAMGRLGGHEMGYASDADVMFVHVPVSGTAERASAEAAHAVAQEMRRILALPGDAPALELDAGLRPEGRQGPLVRTLASYSAYYARWSQPWETQALLRAEPLVGDTEVCQRFRAVIDPLRWPAAGLDAASETEIRRIKARVDAERLPRGADPSMHVKLGPGGLTDVEWTVQLLQLRHAHHVPGLRTTATLPALEAAVAAQLLDRTDADALGAAWRLAQRLRNQMMLARGRASDSLPRDPRDRAAVAYLLGKEIDEFEQVTDEWRRTARRARAVVERVFWT
ncbi:MAG: bifunctional [glutamine synthetase] adenylyltransferase/[glutamine synthetase]-adenylyl-L-tyrosine phosphorylase [Nocardioidaceae bacterium]|nr:bifunctional [glutamine synthetase] adenylyltransferase/[glutamine synthetase]-adenylyl-L-tyrosine phosphorylase [Nocardioidaceae bacterium]